MGSHQSPQVVEYASRFRASLRAAVISIVILNAHGKKGHGAKFTCPILKLSSQLSAILYVDNTNLLHINLDKDKSVASAHKAIQSSVRSWGDLLIAMGGVLHPAKCFNSIIYFDWVQGGIVDNFGVEVPLPGGSSTTIAHRPVTHAEKTLGAMTSPNGNCLAAIQMMHEKARHWIDSIKNGQLYHRNVWFSLGIQFWPRVGYSLCNSAASYNKLESAQQK